LERVGRWEGWKGFEGLKVGKGWKVGRLEKVNKKEHQYVALARRASMSIEELPIYIFPVGN